MTRLTPSFRYPAEIPDSAAHPQVKATLQSHTQSLVDLNQAVVSLKAQMGTSTPATATAAVSGGSTGSTQTVVNNTVSGGPVNDQSNVASYTTTQSDSGALLVFNSATAVAVTLNFGVTVPWYCFVTNQGAGVVTMMPQQGTINGAASQTVAMGYFSIVFFDGNDFWSCVLPNVPMSFAAAAHQFLTSFNMTTGAFTAAQPSFADISGQIATSQLPSSSYSGTITTAKLTTGGSNGSMTLVNGSITAQVQAT